MKNKRVNGYNLFEVGHKMINAFKVNFVKIHFEDTSENRTSILMPTLWNAISLDFTIRITKMRSTHYSVNPWRAVGLAPTVSFSHINSPLQQTLWQDLLVKQLANKKSYRLLKLKFYYP